jgi:hypothetical protein
VRFKLALSYLEIGLGLTALLFSVYSFVGQFSCPVRAVDCGGWQMLGAQFGLDVGLALFASGLLLQAQGIKSWLGHVLIAYALSFFFLLG